MECIWIAAEDLIAHILLSKTNLEKKKLTEVTTNIEEIKEISSYISQEIIGTRCIIENSLEEILGGIQIRCDQISYNQTTKNIQFLPRIKIKNKRLLKKMYPLHPKITKLIKEYLEKNKTRDQYN